MGIYGDEISIPFFVSINYYYVILPYFFCFNIFIIVQVYLSQFSPTVSPTPPPPPPTFEPTHFGFVHGSFIYVP